MTKYLIKIISICSFVVLLPVIVAGVTLSAIGSTLFNLDAFVAFVGGENANASYALYGGEKEQDKTKAENNKLSLSYINGTEVSLSLDLTGYDFLGWFNGDDKVTYDAAQRLDKDNAGTAYNFELTGNTQLTAFLQSKQYNLAFTGVDKDDADIGTQYNSDTYKYGAALPKLTNPADGKKVFLGWKLVGGNDELLNVATFANSNVGADPYVLNAVWSDVVTIEYYNYDFLNDQVNTTPFYTVKLNEAEFGAFTFITADDENFKVGLGKGYEFNGWTNMPANGEATEITAEQIIAGGFTPGTTVKVFMKKTPVQYTVTVSGTEATFTYDVVNGFVGAEPTRQYYTFTGLNHNDTEYVKTVKDGEKVDYVADNKSLGDEIIAGNTQSITATATWECVYPELTFYFVARDDEGNGVYGVSGGQYYALQQNTGFGGGMDFVTFTVDDLEGIKLEDNFYGTLLKKLAERCGVDHFDACAIQPEDEYQFVDIEYVELEINQGTPHKLAKSILETKTFASVITDYINGTTFNAERIEINLIFELQ